MDIKQMIFYLAGHEKELCMLGTLTHDDETWIKEAIGDYNDDFTNEDLRSLSIQDISELVSDFIEHCEEMNNN